MSTLSGSVAVDGGETPGEQVTDEEVMGSVGEGVKDEKGSTQGQVCIIYSIMDTVEHLYSNPLK